MTDTTELAGLLRQAAEKWPEKFMLDVDELLGVKASPPFPPLVGLDELDCAYSLTLDHMDSIAQALGMFFDVSTDGDENFWAYRVYHRGRVVDCLPPKTQWAGFPDKRSASIAALIAILQHKLSETP